MCDRFPGWTTQDDKRADRPEDPATVWEDAQATLDDEADKIGALIDTMRDRAGTDDAETADRARAIAAEASALRAKLAQLLKDA